MLMRHTVRTLALMGAVAGVGPPQSGGSVGGHNDVYIDREYSCHEGNYALEGILSGARYQESQAGR